MNGTDRKNLKAAESAEASAARKAPAGRLRKIALVGSPNVGKSALFGALSGKYVAVSNYPGTTVEISRGQLKIADTEYEIIDTPGMYSFRPLTEEEHVARKILTKERPDLVIHVTDAKNIERMLPLTFQLMEASLPTLLVLNIMDEAEQGGMHIDVDALSEELGIPVAATVSTTGRGIEELKQKIQEYQPAETGSDKLVVSYSERIEKAIGDILRKAAAGLNEAAISRRSAALLLLRQDTEITELVKDAAPADFEGVGKIVNALNHDLLDPLEHQIAVRLQEKTRVITAQVVIDKGGESGFREKLSRMMMRPLTGFPILLLVLYLGLYKFVGGFGAGTVVNYLEGTVFEGYINPFLIKIFTAIIPWKPLQELVVGEYGVLTMGFRYAVALILPLVTFFFLVFAIIEDTGYLPRLAMLIDRIFKKIGLSGRAVIPMVLGLGCGTMATMVTRTLPTKRERILSTMLLALAIPCSAQLGVILAVMEGRPVAVLIWAGIVGLVFMITGFIAAKVLPGGKASFYMELPPLRLPKLSNVLIKTYARVAWYFKEVLPLFLLASVMIWLGQLTRLFDLCIFLLRKPVQLMGLPHEAAKVFLFGFFRRDYGAAGLYDLNKQDLLTGTQLLVACVALTLFLPCIAQFLMVVKERGWKTGVGICVFIVFCTFAVAVTMNLVLTTLRVTL